MNKTYDEIMRDIENVLIERGLWDKKLLAKIRRALESSDRALEKERAKARVAGYNSGTTTHRSYK